MLINDRENKMKNRLFSLAIIITLLGVFIIYCKISIQHQNNINSIIEERNLELEGLEKEIENEKIKSDKLEKELEEKQKLYEELDKKYQEEIQPVSYNKYNLLSPSGATINKLKYALEGTGLEGLEESYIKAEKEEGINALFLVSLTAEESGWGTSNRAIKQNNLSGFEVYSKDSKGAYFNSKEESILTTAKLLKNHYLTPGGQHYYGYSIYDVNKKYCTTGGISWSKNISSIANSLVKKINNR